MRPEASSSWYFLLLAVAAVVVASSCEDVRVTAVDVGSLTVTPAEATLFSGDTLRLEVILRDGSGNVLPDRPIDWSSANPEVALPDNDGLVRGMAPGTTPIRASAGGATGEASITVAERPVIVLSDSRIDLEASAGGGPSETRSVEISNGGVGTLGGLHLSVSYESGEPTGWLEAGLQGTTAPTTVSLRALPGALPLGTHRAEVEVRSDVAENSPQVIEVTFEVREAPPAIAVEPRAVGFASAEGQGAPPSQTVSVTNSGERELTDLEVSVSYVEGEPTGWLEAELAGTTAPTELTLRVDPTGLVPPATFDAVVEVTSPVAPGAPGTVSMRFRYGTPPPEIELDPTELTWVIVELDPEPPTAEVSIRNRGTGTLGSLSASVDYPSGGPTDWLGVELSSSTAPSVLTVEITDTDLLPGQYEATVRIASPDAINSPLSVDVEVQVEPRAWPDMTTITADPESIVADGTSTSTITVQLRDRRGDPMPSGGDEVELSGSSVTGTDPGSLSSPVTDHGDGTYTATLTSSTEAGTVTVTGTVNGEEIGDDAEVEFVAGAPANVVITGGDNQTGTVGEELPDLLEVRVEDGESNGVSGVTVTWSPADGSADPTSSPTDPGGFASTTWTLGTTAGEQTLEASADGADPDTFTADAEADDPDPSESSATVPDGTAGDETTITIEVADQHGNPVEGVGSSLSVEVSGANTASPTATEVGNGTYEASYTPTEAGTDTVEIELDETPISGSPFESDVSPGSAANIVITDGNNQTGTVGEELPDLLEVRVEDGEGNGVSGVTVTWSAADGSADPPSSTTGPGGFASTAWTLGTTAGGQTLEASANGGVSDTFTADAEANDPDPSGSSATVPGGTAGEETTITIEVADQHGNPVEGVGSSLSVEVSGENTASPSVSEVGDGTYEASYTPTEAGTDTVEIELDETPIDGSPFTSQVSPGSGT